MAILNCSCNSVFSFDEVTLIPSKIQYSLSFDYVLFIRNAESDFPFSFLKAPPLELILARFWCMKQLHLIPEFNARKEHGGTFSLGKRRKQRPLSLKKPLHLVLRSDFSYGSRSLLRHRPLIARIIAKAKKRFVIRVYEMAIVSNHIHIVIKGRTRQGLQNFFRVVAGHIAQELLRQFPILQIEKAKQGGASKTREKENKFWQTRIYSRIVSWGREYSNVKEYVVQNTIEALGLIPYKTRAKRSPALKKISKIPLKYSREGGARYHGELFVAATEKLF